MYWTEHIYDPKPNIVTTKLGVKVTVRFGCVSVESDVRSGRPMFYRVGEPPGMHY
jgi:hypothetical protein